MAIVSGQRCGFIGLGLMGGPMAANLRAAGVDLAVHNRSPEKMRVLVEDGAVGCASAAEVGRFAPGDIIIICVTDTPAVEGVLFGADNRDGLLEDLAPGTIVIDMGTTAVADTKRFAAVVEERGGSYVDAPVSGGELGARAGSLTIMAGGPAQAVERCGPVFDMLGKSWIRIGPVGCGQVAKAANQLIVGANVLAVAEALALARAAGADMRKTRTALLGGFAASAILEVHGQRMIDETFAPGGRATTTLKDLNQALDLAAQSGIELSGLSHIRDVWQAMVDAGFGDLDQAGLIKMVGRQTG